MDNNEFASIIIGKLLNISGMLQKQGNKMLATYGLNQQQYTVFYEIAKAEKVMQKDMVNRLQLEKANVSKIVKKLQQMGLITLTVQEEDKRSSWLSITSQGKEVLNNCSHMFKEWNRGWTEGISTEELTSIVDHMAKLQEIFKNYTQK